MATFPLDARTELLLNGVWTDVSTDVRHEDGITIKRGRSEEASNAEPSTCNLTFDNDDGKFSPRNPNGAYYGMLGRNTPLRVRTPTTEQNYLDLDAGDPFVIGGFSSYATTPDHASLDITGDLDVRVDIRPRTWRPTMMSGLAQKYVIPSNQRSWAFWLNTDGTLTFRWSPDGATFIDATSTAAVPSTSTRLVVRATIDVNNGASGRTVRFYTDTNINGSFTLLGAAVTTSGVTSIFNSSAPVDVGVTNAVLSLDAVMQGKFYAAQIRSGIGGTVVASPTFSALDTQDNSLTDAQSRVWSLSGTASIANPGARFHGEVSAWPPKWDITHRNRSVPIEASGILRRLSQGQPPKESTMRRYMLSQSDVVAYWPCEDPEGSDSLTSGLAGKPPMEHLSGNLDKAQYDGFTCSDPIPYAGTVQWEGVVAPYTYTGVTQVQFLMAVPTGSLTSISTILRVFTSGNAPWWKLNISNTTGQLRFLSYDYDDVIHEDTGFTGADLRSKRVSIIITFEHTGSAIDWTVKAYEMGESSAIVSLSGTQTSQTFGRVRRVNINMEDSILDSMAGVAIGHIVVRNQLVPWGGREVAMGVAYSGETAAQRILRLCVEEGHAVTIVGDATDSVAVGPQTSQTFLELVQEAAFTDMGIIYEPREFLGLAYRTRSSLYAQEAAVTLDYEARTMSSIEPVEDDDAIRNDITVTRTTGGSYRYALESGPMSILPPSQGGVGKYDDEATVSLWRENQLPGQAEWRVHVGTVDEARYPVLGIDLSTEAFKASAPLSLAAETVDIGGRLVVSNPPASVPPEDITQLVQGMTEHLNRFQWSIDLNCAPSSPYDVAVWDDSSGVGEARYSADSTVLAEDLTTVETGVNISTPTGPDWSSTAVPYDIMVGGERMTVTAVSGAGVSQTFTVTRSVNGIVKTHATGAAVALFKPAIAAL